MSANHPKTGGPRCRLEFCFLLEPLTDNSIFMSPLPLQDPVAKGLLSNTSSTDSQNSHSLGMFGYSKVNKSYYLPSHMGMGRSTWSPTRPFAASHRHQVGQPVGLSLCHVRCITSDARIYSWLTPELMPHWKVRSMRSKRAKCAKKAEPSDRALFGP